METKPVLYVLETRGITKRFSGVEVLTKVDFNVLSGETHAVLGENGAGKSTLMKIIMGLYMPDEGEIFFEGKRVHSRSPSDALKLGICMIYQELNVLPHLTIAENIFLGRELVKGILVDRRQMNIEAKKLMQEFSLNLDPNTPMRRLSIAQAQLVEIIKMVSTNAKIVIMDEPTSSLTDKEVQELYTIIRRLKEKGVSIIYISHRMAELFIVADRVSVFRDGSLVKTHDMRENVTNSMLIKEMVGRELNSLYPKQEAQIGDVVLEVRGLTRKNVINDISFIAKRGEILGFAGLVGAGRTETMRAIFGMDPYDSGETYLDGKKLRIRSPKDAIRNGIVMASEDRKNTDLVLCRSVRENISLPNLWMMSNFFILNARTERKLCRKISVEVAAKITGIEQMMSSLSGGNQQKIVLAKWLLSKAKVMILDEPTRGIDVGAKTEIYRIVSGLAAKGMTIILVSSDMPEILGICDRILVLCDGSIRGEFMRDEVLSGKVSQEDILSVALGGNLNECFRCKTGETINA